ncbi:uncharacterized protein EAF01_004866 [Botrytis porri]|uniref:uncharacterized protein n=1 Tax=Botrytis porri TaxID=87229 RepID=UPI0019027FDC|nr:uncharacterized protein EAF01_004866 [Botrytis porri]KAF7907279.1 hypothetical protein EAF01_004866 [Botrytis porri]
MFIGKYQPGVMRGVTPTGRTYIGVAVASPAGTVVHQDTILFWMPPSAGEPENYTTSDNTFPPEAIIRHGLQLLNLPVNAFSHLEPPDVNFYDSFIRNSLRHPSLVGDDVGFVVPTHGIPFAHSCYPNAICLADIRNKTIEFHGIGHYDCPRECKLLSYIDSDSRRAEFFRRYAAIETVLDSDEFEVQVHLACQLSREHHLEAYLLPFLSKAELHARKNNFSCRGSVQRILIAVMERQAEINHPSVEFARVFEHSTFGLEDDQRMDSGINT